MPKPLWWDFVSNEQKVERLSSQVLRLQEKIRDLQNTNDPLNVKTRDRILHCERENVLLRKQISELKKQGQK